MTNFPASNLPERSLQWGRSVEDEFKAVRAENDSLRSALNTANNQNATLSNQIEQVTGWVRTLCQTLGTSFPPVYVPPAPPVIIPDNPSTPPPAPTTKTDEIQAQWSATWYQGYKRTANTEGYDDKRSLYQRGTGYTFSMWRFDIGAAGGKNITGAQMYLKNISTYYGGNFTAFLGTHGSGGEPGSRPPGGRTNPFDAGWAAGEGKWIDLPDWTYKGLSNGSIQGFTLGDLNRDNNNFARFAGVGRAGTPVLRLTYEV